MRILAIDPGPKQSGFVVFDNGLIEFDTVDNETLLSRLKERSFGGSEACAIEMIASYGMPVGEEVFETCVWIGRFVERAGIPVYRFKRKDITLHVCNSPRATDSTIRCALIDKYGVQGTKKSPGPTYGMKGHLWAALAVADYAIHKLNQT